MWFELEEVTAHVHGRDARATPVPRPCYAHAIDVGDPYLKRSHQYENRARAENRTRDENRTRAERALCVVALAGARASGELQRRISNSFLVRRFRSDAQTAVCEVHFCLPTSDRTNTERFSTRQSGMAARLILQAGSLQYQVTALRLPATQRFPATHLH